MTYVVTSTELYHHGILGQKWGVRRFQNPDGTLTEAGKKRYIKEFERAEQKSFNARRTKSFDELHKNLNETRKNLFETYLKDTKEYKDYQKALHELEDEEDRIRSMDISKINSESFKDHDRLVEKTGKASDKYLQKLANVYSEHHQELATAKLKDLNIKADDAVVAFYEEYRKQKFPKFDSATRLDLFN